MKHFIVFAAIVLAGCTSLREAWRSHPPEPVASWAWVIPTYQRSTLPNGVTVYSVEDRRVPLVGVYVAFRAGSATDPPGKAGLAMLAYDSLMEGAGTRDDRALAEAFGALGTQPWPWVGPDGAAIGAVVVEANAEKTLAILSDVVRTPRLADGGIVRRQAALLDVIADAANEPWTLVMKALRPALYGPEHPYAQPVEGTPETVRAISPDDVRRFHRRFVTPNNVAVVMAGDVTNANARAWAERAFGSWTGTGETPPVPPVPEARPPGKPVVIPRPGATQTLVAFAKLGVPLGHADEIPLALVVSRLESGLDWDLRHEEKLTYDAGVWLMQMTAAGAVIGSSWVRGDATGDAVGIAFKSIEDMDTRSYVHDTSYRGKAHSRSVQGLLRSSFWTFDGVDGLAWGAVRLFWRRLPDEWYRQHVNAIKEITPDQARAVIPRYLDRKDMHVVLVGDPKVLEAQAKDIESAR